MANLYMNECHMKYNIDLAEDFSPFPFGRYTPLDGEFTGEVFREKILKDKLVKIVSGDELVVNLNGIDIGIGSSFLTESFGGAVKKGYIDKILFLDSLKIICDDGLYDTEIRDYIKEAQVES